MKGHQNNPQTPRNLPRWDHAPGYEIPGFATVLDLKATDFDHINYKICLTHRRRNSVSMGVGVSVVSPAPTPLCNHVQDINVCTSYVVLLTLNNQINCLKNNLHAEFFLSFGSLIISMHFNVFYILIC